MQVGIVGLPFSGKTTLFETLLVHRSHSHHSGKFKGETERGIVKVPDNRLEKLASIFKTQKTTYASVEYIKVPGIEKEEHKSHGLPAQFLANTKTVDLILIMIRAFKNDVYPHPLGSVDPRRDILFINSEFLLSDLWIIENRIEKLEKLVMKTQQDKDKKELDVLRKCHMALEEEKPIRELCLDQHEQMIIKGFQFLTAKPLLYVLNIEESDITEGEKLEAQYRSQIGAKCLITALSAEIEKEIAELDEEDACDFLADLKINQAATNKLIRASYELLGLISFFTINEEECRAWTIPKGTHAQQAAGTIHTDMEQGFIRAEVVSFDTLMAEGGWQKCKEKGQLRLEGKDYIVKDGDVLSIRFNV